MIDTTDNCINTEYLIGLLSKIYYMRILQQTIILIINRLKVHIILMRLIIAGYG